MPDEGGSPVIPKQEHPSRESSPHSVDSVGEVDGEGEVDGQASPPQNAPIQKRKGGRKPIYATSEERKQRNRQAQAAFRERRTEYIKQLETTIKRHEESLQSLQQSHRSAADECLMLRYKNSLLERILLEKGIDVQGELKRKEITPPARMPPPLPHPTPIHRPVSSRHRHMHRLSSGSAPIMSKGVVYNSPQLKSSPSSQVSSPTSIKSPVFGATRGPSLAQPSFQTQEPQQQQQQVQSQPQPQQQQPSRSSTYPGLSEAANRPGLQAIAPNLSNGLGANQRGHWPSPFQTHNEQLEQEYGAGSEMMDDVNDGTEEMQVGPGPYPQHLEQQQAQPYTSGVQGLPITMTSDAHGRTETASAFGHMFDPSDPMLDADPFGLTASMHFPTPFSFQESSLRR